MADWGAWAPIRASAQAVWRWAAGGDDAEADEDRTRDVTPDEGHRPTAQQGLAHGAGDECPGRIGDAAEDHEQRAEHE